MSTVRVIFFATTGFVLVALVGCIGASRIIARQSDELSLLHSRQESLSAELQRLRRATSDRSSALASTPPEAASLAPNVGATPIGPDSLIEIETKAWLARLNNLKGILAQNPGLGIPELSLLDEREWLRIAKDAQFATAEHTRKSLAALRDAAKEQFIMRLSFALRKYLERTDGELPPTAVALAPYFDQPVDPAIFAHYEMVRTGNVSAMPSRMRAVIREKAPIDEDYDGRYGLDGNAVRMGGGNNARTWINDPDGYDGMLRRAKTEFARINPGAKASGLEQLAPYINPPLAPAKLEKLLELEREQTK